MLCSKRRHAALVVLCVLLSFVCFARNVLRAQPAQHSATANDEAALRSLVGQFFDAYAKEDSEGWLRLWSAKSPELAARRKSLQQLFADDDRIEVKDILIGRLAVEGDSASLRVSVEINAVEAKTGKPATGLGKMNRAFRFVKEEGMWKVWGESSAEEDLVAALLAAKSEVERAALLEADKELMTVELRKALIARGRSLSQRGDFSQALILDQLAQTLAEKIGDKAGLTTALYRIGGDYRNQGNFNPALEYLQKALALARESQDKSAMAAVLYEIGAIHSSRGAFDLALETLQNSLSLGREAGNKNISSLALNNIAITYARLGQYDQALDSFQESLRIQEEVGNKSNVAAMLGNIGNVYRHQGNYGLALETYQKSLRLCEESGSKDCVALTLNNIGNVYYFQNDYDLALEFYSKSLALKVELGVKQRIAVSLGNVGNIKRDQGNYGQALDYYKKSLAIYEEIKATPDMPDVLKNVGNTYLLQGDYKQALDYSQRGLTLAESVGEQVGIIASLNQIALVRLAQKDYGKALESAERATVIARQIGERDELWGALVTKGKAQRALGQTARARQSFDDAIETVEALRSDVAGGEQQQQSFFADKLAPYHEVVDLLLAQNKAGEAFTYAERARARVLLDVLRSGRVNVTKAMTAQEQAQERSFSTQMVSLNTQIAREESRKQPDAARISDLKTRLQTARRDHEAFQNGLYAAHPELKVQRGEAQTIKLEETAELLPDTKSALLEYVVTDEKTYLFVLTRSSRVHPAVVDVKVYPLAVKQKELAERTERFRQSLAARDLRFREPASELYDLLLKPARAELQDKATLVIVPDGVLWQFPFQALQPGPNRYLLEDYAISYSPSLTVLREMSKVRKREAQPVASLLAFGNPSLGRQTVERLKSVNRDEDLAPLPEAEKEVEVLRQLYGAARSKVYVGAEAREDRIKTEAGQYGILHLATHGVLNNASPMYSHLVLSQTDGSASEDGLLETWEIMNLDLRAKLVVLSACETGRGRLAAGEGVIGLAWAVFVAGCPTTVVSQWKVDSAGTTELMSEFHRRLHKQTGNASPDVSTARALQQAAIKLLHSKDYRHPFYWAGFVVVGDGR
ncbi:MAG: CHAT domain-containing protein [Acidobacteriota bacterium]